MLNCLFVPCNSNKTECTEQNKGQEEIKANLDNGLKSISDKLSKDPFQDKVQETHSKLSALPERIEAFLLHFQNDIRQTLSKERQACMNILLNNGINKLKSKL